MTELVCEVITLVFEPRNSRIRHLPSQDEPEHKLIEFLKQKSVFDRECADCPAQYASAKETPTSKWDEVSTKFERPVHIQIALCESPGEPYCYRL